MQCAAWRELPTGPCSASRVLPLRARVALELDALPRLLAADAADRDLGAAEALGLDGRAGEAAQQRELAHVRQRVGDGTLEDHFRRELGRLARGEACVELAERGEEALDVALPVAERIGVPRPVAVGEIARPVHEISEMADELERRARRVADPVRGELLR